MKKQSQSGFTLVELAVVMIIIGLLIGGVLKGQELINNAQIAATVAQVKGVDAATTTFRDMYNGYPGDILTPATRLSNCTGLCDNPGDANNRLDRLPNAYGAADEASAFFPQLGSADLVTGINQANGATWGGAYPTAKIAGGLHPSYSQGVAANFVNNGVNPLGGFYLTLTGNPGAAPDAASGVVSPNQAQRIDTKVDDGVGNTGSVRSFGTNCDAAGVYDEDNPNKVCGLHIRFQG